MDDQDLRDWWNDNSCDNLASDANCPAPTSATAATPEPTAEPTSTPTTAAPTPPNTNIQTSNCWAPADGVSETLALTCAKAEHTLSAGDDYFEAVMGPCSECVNSTLLVNQTQTGFDCTSCPAVSVTACTWDGHTDLHAAGLHTGRYKPESAVRVVQCL